jgi:hypothetical protein
MYLAILNTALLFAQQVTPGHGAFSMACFVGLLFAYWVVCSIGAGFHMEFAQRSGFRI